MIGHKIKHGVRVITPITGMNLLYSTSIVLPLIRYNTYTQPANHVVS
jgi:hypothetical protein